MFNFKFIHIKPTYYYVGFLTMTEEDVSKLVGYCGCYCGLCGVRVCFPKLAQQLKETLHQEGMDFWYRYVPSMRKTFPIFCSS